jgi:hypothetical protein
MMSPISKLKRIWNQPVSGIVELWAGTLTLVWGIWLLIPWDTFSDSRSYDLMAHVMPEWAWGSAFTIIGTMKVYAFFCCSQRVRRKMVLLLIFLYSILYGSIIAAVPISKSASPILILFIILLLGFIFLKLGNEVHHNGNGN